MAAWRVSRAILAILIFELWLPQLLVAQPLWQTGTLEAVEKKLESTPRTYVWDVVVTSTDVITYRLHKKSPTEHMSPITLPTFSPPLCRRVGKWGDFFSFDLSKVDC